MASGPETKLVAAMRAAILKKWPEAWVRKIHGSPFQHAGIPDLLVCVDGRLIGIEAKCRHAGESEKHALARTSVTQLAEHHAMTRAGATVGVALSVEQALALVEARHVV